MGALDIHREAQRSNLPKMAELVVSSSKPVSPSAFPSISERSYGLTVQMLKPESGTFFKTSF